jgi:hypothetical protein
VNWRHLYAFLWLRWRIRYNQIKKAGALNAIITAMALISMIPGVLILFSGALAVGMFALPMLDREHPELFPMVVMFVYDGLTLGFLFAWTIGLVAELQRSEALSLDKFLHLPVSLSGVFLINYLSSLASFNLLVFVPVVLGLSVGLALGSRLAFLVLLPLLAAFFLAVTALTYQLQGWLAALMVNKRRRRAIAVFATLAIILVSQIPNLINLYRPWKMGPIELAEKQTEELKALQKQLADQEITAEEYNKRAKEVTEEYQAKTQHSEKALLENAQKIAWTLNIVLPPGWLALGATTLAEGGVVPAILGTLGLGLIGAASLWRAYRTTLRLYTGEFSAGKRQPAVATPAAPATPALTAKSLGFVERRVPWVSEQASAIALFGLRSLIRAPEAKMLLLTPFIVIVVFGGVFFAQHLEPPLYLRPLIAFGAVGTVLLTMAQLVGNQFGFDRAGFRIFVLCPAPRRDILLGKNLSVAPLATIMALVMVIIIQIVYPMRIDHLVMILLQIGFMYLLFCSLFNWMSVLAPAPIAQGSLKVVKPKFTTVLIQMAFGMLLPLANVPALLPLGIEFLLDYLGVLQGVPIALGLSLIEGAVVVFIYWRMLDWQGRTLQALEQKILETVTTKAE